MAATKAICFSEPAQPIGFSVKRASSNLTAALHPLWRYAYLVAASRLALQTQEAKP